MALHCRGKNLKSQFAPHFHDQIYLKKGKEKEKNRLLNFDAPLYVGGKSAHMDLFYIQKREL